MACDAVKKSDWGKAVGRTRVEGGASAKGKDFFSSLTGKGKPFHPLYCFPERSLSQQNISRLSYLGHPFDGNLECFH